MSGNENELAWTPFIFWLTSVNLVFQINLLKVQLLLFGDRLIVVGELALSLSVDNKKYHGDDGNESNNDEHNWPPTKSTTCRSTAVVITERWIRLLSQVGQLGSVVWVTTLGNAKFTGKCVPGKTAEFASGCVLFTEKLIEVNLKN